MASHLDACVPRFMDLFRAPKAGFLELCGFSGAGKTQLLLDLCCRIALSAQARVVFIDTEGGFDAQRFWQVAIGSTGSKQAASRLLDRLVVYRVFDALELQFVLCDLLDQLRDCSTSLPFNSLIVDTVAFPFRSDARRLKDCTMGLQCNEVSPVTGPVGSIDKGMRRRPWEYSEAEASKMLQVRASALKDIGKCLQEIAGHRVAVMVSNHVKWTPDGVVPTLGWSWQKQVARRILLERLEGLGQRRATVLIAAAGDTLLEGMAVGFRVIEAGVQGEDEVGNDESANDAASDDDDAMDAIEFEKDEVVHDKFEIDESSSEEALQDDELCDCPELHRPNSIPSQRRDATDLVWPPRWWTSRPCASPTTAGSLLRICQLSHVHNAGVPCCLRHIFPGLHPSGLGGILEVCGEAGTGKTQFCLHSVVATLASAFTDCSAKFRPPCVLYLYSEDVPVARLKEIAADGNAVLDSIFLEPVNTPDRKSVV